MSNCMLFENNLMTMVCLGEVLLIFCHLLPIVGKTDSESNTLNTVMEFNRTDNQIVDKKTLRIFMNNNPTTKRLLINTQRKKINFENLLNKYHNKPINITSTCTPFFVQKTKMAHRKKQRLKKPIGMSTGKTIDPPSTESLQDKGKIIHSKHSTAYFSAASSSSTSDDKIMQKKKISNTIDLLKSCLPKNRSYIESGLSYDGLSNTPLNGNQITLDPRTVKYNITSGTKMFSATKEVGDDHYTLQCYIANESLKTHQSKEYSSLSYKSVINRNQFNIKNIFHVSKASSPTKTGGHLQHYNISQKSPSSIKTTQNETVKLEPITNASTTFRPTSVLQFLNIFHKLKQLKHFPTVTSNPNHFDSTEPVVFETQIPSSPIQDVLDKECRPITEIPLTAELSKGLTKTSSKYMRLKNLVHKNPRTSTSSFDTLSKDVEGYFTSKQTNFDTKCGSETTFTPSITKGKHGLNSDIIRENKNKTHLMKPLNQGAENEEESNQTLVKTTISKGNKEFEQSSINKLVGSKISSHIKPEDTITRSPFKVKYLMRFKNFKSSTQHCPSDSTLLSLASSENYEKDTPVTKENFNFDITTKPMSAVNIHFDSKTSNPTCNNTAKHKVMKNNPTTTKGFEGLGSLETSEHTDNTLVVSTQIYEDIRGLRKSTEYDLRRYKYPGRIENHNYNNRKLDNSASDSFKEMFNVTVHTNSGERFRDWFLGKNKIPAINKTYNKKDNCTFRWCFQLSSTNSITVTKPLPSYVTTETPVQSSEEHLIQSTFAPNKKIKHFFHLKHSHNTLPLIVSENNTVVDSALSDVTKEYIHNSNAPETSTRRGGKDNTLNVNLIPYNYDTTTNENQRGTLSNRTQIEFAFTTEPNMSVNKTGRGKVKQFFHKFYTDKIHVIKLNKTNSLQQENSTALTKSVAFADNVESKVETKKHEFYPNITDVRNAADINDTSFNVMAFVMKPFDSLVGVFKALSPNSITKIGDVNATDIKNGSLPDHLQPPNSSIVILAVNNTNATSKDIHESKLDMALDLLGGMYHCVFSSFVEAKPEDVHFHLYTRKNPEEPEELFLPQEQPLDNVTDNANIPKPVLEEELKTEIPYNKREIENEEDYYEDYEFEPLHPAKSSIQSKWFNVFAETKVLIHGYLQDYQTDVMVSMKDAYLSRGPYNVVVVDWSVLVGESSCYPVVASRGLQQVGGLLAQLLDHLVYAGVSPSNIHIVGFSLGAHVAGHAGTFLGHGLVSRITGLDPALPYVPMEPDISLDAGDAVFVDIIHSAAGLLGQSGPMGHIDFYPNGGSQQPGCEVSSLSCSHRRAALYFIESITSEVGFPATRCDSWHHYQTDNCSISETVLMGDPCPANASGKFYLVTGYKSPFVLQPEEHVQVKKSLLLDLFYDSEDL